MIKILRAFILLIAALALLCLAGCGEDDDGICDLTENVAPTVTLSPSGGDIFTNTIIVATCSKVVDSLTVSSGAIAFSVDNKVWTFSLQGGTEHSITVVCIDGCGDSGSATGIYNVWELIDPYPEIKGAECNPGNGAEDIDPADVSEIILVFNYNLSNAEITSFEPEADISSELDGDVLTISFLGGYSLPSKQRVVIELTVENLAGNTAVVEYSFTTKAKE